MKKRITLLSSVVYLVSLLALTGCYTSLPGTHVEVIERDGRKAYVVGAVGMGATARSLVGQRSATASRKRRVSSRMTAMTSLKSLRIRWM